MATTEDQSGNDSEYITYAAFAARIGATRSSVGRWVHEGMPKVSPGMLDLAEAQSWLRAHPRSSVAFDRSAIVYFVQRLDGAVKIGFTSDLSRRLREVRRDHGDVRTLATAPGAGVAEGVLHRRFAAFRVEGEWFSPDAAILTFATETAERGWFLPADVRPAHIPKADLPNRGPSRRVAADYAARTAVALRMVRDGNGARVNHNTMGRAIRDGLVEPTDRQYGYRLTAAGEVACSRIVATQEAA